MLGSLVSAGANIIGGLMGMSNAKDARDAASQHSAQQAALQKEFAQNGIRWRVEDAKAAGIHPIYALGSSGASFSPVSQNFSADTSLPNALAAAGQDIGRSINATRTGSEKLSAFTQTAQALSLEKAGLENDLLRAEIASKTGRLRATPSPDGPSVGNPYLIEGQPNSGLKAKDEAQERVASAPGAPHQEHAAIPDVAYARTSTGWVPVPAKHIKERIEDNFIQERLWDIRNNLFPSMGNFDPPKGIDLKPGHAWWFNPIAQEYQQVKWSKEKAPFSWVPKFEWKKGG